MRTQKRLSKRRLSNKTSKRRLTSKNRKTPKKSKRRLTSKNRTKFRMNNKGEEQKEFALIKIGNVLGNIELIYRKITENKIPLYVVKELTPFLTRAYDNLMVSKKKLF